MKIVITIVLLILTGLFAFVSAQDQFNRTMIINSVTYEGNGFGGIIGPVDFDNDGKKEIYMCNTNTIDLPVSVLIPRLYKFEFSGTAWEMVWMAETNIPLQNTWPAISTGDLDGDGKPEIHMGPVNYLDASTNPNPPRILVYEYPGDGTDNMGVSDGVGGFLPNAKTSIVAQDNFNLRPCRFVVEDVDNDGKDEIIFCDRAGGGAGDYHVGIFSVSDIPDDASGLEVWDEEFTGSGDINIASLAGNNWDVNVLNNFVYLWGSNTGESIFPVKFNGTSYESLPAIDGAAFGNSLRGSQVADINGDNNKEIVYGSWFAPAKVFLLQQNGDGLVVTEIADFTGLNIQRIVGSAQGDLNSNGKIDFVFGTRWVDATTPNFAVLRLAYLGGDITNPANYATSIIDSGAVLGGESDVITVGNFDADSDDEVIYTAGYPRGPAPDVIDVYYLDRLTTSVEMENNNVPSQFFVDQNYPNPFNPSTQIKFGITEAANVDLRIYDVLGREVAVLVNNEYLSAGSYNTKFNAVDLASGIYVYRLTAGANTVSRKMQLLK